MACSTLVSSSHSHILFKSPSKIPTFRPSPRPHIHTPFHPCKTTLHNLTHIQTKCPVFQLTAKRTNSAKTDKISEQSDSEIECIGTGTEVECMIDENSDRISEERDSDLGLIANLWEWAVLISPFFFWGTAMVAMKEVLPKVGPFYVASFRLIPAGLLLIGFATVKGRPLPSGFNAWFSISLFALVDATFFQVF